MDSNRGCMPEEILFDIFTMLPVKSLCRFRCVSKLWLSIISDPDFVAAHLARSRSRPKLLISVQYLDTQGLLSKSMFSFFSIDYPEQESSAQPLHATSNSSTVVIYNTAISPSPSGLICFSSSGVVKIGNPITGDFDVIPYPIPDTIGRMRKLFFGFDPVEKSHVILKLDSWDYTRDSDSGKSGVFDLVENCWHESQPHPWLDGTGESDVCINGVIYFIANGDEIVHCLYAFDVRSKSFQMIERPADSLPHFPPEGRRFVVERLIEYKGHLAFVGDGDLEGTVRDEIKMWILEDIENRIWSFKSFVVPWRENLIREGISIDTLESVEVVDCYLKVSVFGATHRGELILATSLWNISPAYLFLYEIETNTLRRFQLDGLGNTPRGLIRFNLVIESLQSPKDFNKKEEESC